MGIIVFIIIVIVQETRYYYNNKNNKYKCSDSSLRSTIIKRIYNIFIFYFYPTFALILNLKCHNLYCYLVLIAYYLYILLIEVVVIVNKCKNIRQTQ